MVASWKAVLKSSRRLSALCSQHLHQTATAVTQFFGVLAAHGQLLMDRLKHKYQEEDEKTGGTLQRSGSQRAEVSFTSARCLP